MTNQLRHTIDLGLLSSASEIPHLMADWAIEAYVYQFRTAAEIIKTGMSADFMSQWGERIYRQAGHLPGWPMNYRLTGSSGSDMALIAQEYREKTGRLLDRNQVAIDVIDMTQSYQPGTHIISDRREQVRRACLELERLLITESVTRMGRLPIGNRDSGSQFCERAYHNEQRIAQFFE